MMVGRGVDLQVKKAEARPGEPVLEVNGLTVLDESGRIAVDGVGLEVRSGEIVGRGRSPGQRPRPKARQGDSGPGPRHRRVGPHCGARLDGGFAQVGASGRGRPYPPRTAYATACWELHNRRESRAGRHDEMPFSRWGALRWQAIYAVSEQRLKDFDIRAHSVHVPVRTLSGATSRR